MIICLMYSLREDVTTDLFLVYLRFKQKYNALQVQPEQVSNQ